MNWGFALWYLPCFVLTFFVLMPLAIRYTEPDDAPSYAIVTFMALAAAWLWIILLPALVLYMTFAEVGRRFDKRNRDREDAS